MRILFIVSVSMMLMSCGSSTPFFQAPELPDKTLVKVSCPEDLGELLDGGFGTTTKKLEEVIFIYRNCRAAAFGAVRAEQ